MLRLISEFSSDFSSQYSKNFQKVKALYFPIKSYKLKPVPKIFRKNIFPYTASVYNQKDKEKTKTVVTINFFITRL